VGVQTVGWIGIGRMGYAMASASRKSGANVTVWNRDARGRRSRSRRTARKSADKLADLAACEIVFVMVSTWKDVKEVIAGPHGLLSAKDVRTKLVIECSSISLEGSAELREVLRARGIELLAAPVSGNAKVIKAGRLSFVCSGPRAAYDQALPYLRMIAPAASYVGKASSRAW
jgi:3-hydroxyisobutyrate dehydrogenase-like beta-hydroxyacid dehydrogenase